MELGFVLLYNGSSKISTAFDDRKTFFTKFDAQSGDQVYGPIFEELTFPELKAELATLDQ
jgi:hypothetical protein